MKSPIPIPFLNKTLLFLLIVYIGSSCKPGDPIVPTYKNPATLKKLNVLKEENPGYTKDGLVLIAKDYIYITLPQEADLSKVYLNFEINDKGILRINGIETKNLSGSFDLTKTIDIEIVGENNSAKRYILLAQKGIRELDELFYLFKEKYSIPGVSFAIMRMDNGEIIYKTGLGFSDKENRIRAAPNHLFRLGSISKQFTSLCIMKLVEQGKFGLESKVFGVGGILEEDFSNITEKAAKVSIRNLLNHSSGWESDPDPMFTGSFNGMDLHKRIEYVLTSTQREPGSTFSYYNMGYGILQKVIEKTSGMPYETFLKEVLSKADITDIHVGGDRSQKRENEVVYYSQDGSNGYLNDMKVIAAAGGVIASTEQMLNLIRYIDGKDNPRDIISNEIREQWLMASDYNRYALGWRMNHPLFPGAWYHGGNLAGTATFWVMGPEYSTVILCNSRSYISGFDDELYYITEKMINYFKNI